MTNTQRIEALERRLGELDGLDGRLRELSHNMRGVDVVGLQRRVGALETLPERVHALEHRETSPTASGTSRGDGAMSDLLLSLQNRMQEMEEQSCVTIEALQREVAELRTTANLTARALGNLPATAMPMEYGRPKVPEPKYYGGARDAKELENFLFDMEQYFLAVRAEERVKVTMATMYLSGDAKLWWRTKYDDIQHGRCTIDNWADLKRELKAQFFLENVEYMARR